VDKDPGEVHHTFLKIGQHASRKRGSSLQLGRQEVLLGSGRLFDFDNNEDPKVTFDEVRWITQTSHLRWDVFTLKLKTEALFLPFTAIG
jgi:hypothetical protein